MTEGSRKVRAHSVYLWIGTAFAIAFNTAAGLSHSADLTYAGLVLTGMAALAGIGFGVWAGRTLAREHRRS